MLNRLIHLPGDARESSIPMIVIGAAGHVSHANAAAHRFLGYSQGMLLGLPMQQLAPASERAALVLVRAAGENATHLRIRSRALRADGRVLDVCLTIEPCMHDSDQVDVFVSYKPLAPWEAQRVDEAAANEAAGLERRAG